MGLDELDASERARGGEGREGVEVVDREDAVAQLVEFLRNICKYINQVSFSERVVVPYLPCLCASS